MLQMICRPGIAYSKSIRHNGEVLSRPLLMSPTAKDKQEVRAIVDKEVYRLLKALAGVKQGSLNKVLNQAIDQYLESDSTRELIEGHNLEDDLNSDNT